MIPVGRSKGLEEDGRNARKWMKGSERERTRRRGAESEIDKGGNVRD